MSLGSTYLRRNGRWESRLSLGVVNGKRQSKSFYGSSREEAESKLILAVFGNASINETKMAVKDLCAEWLSVSSHRVKLSTLANYHMKIEKHIIPQLGDMMCYELSSKILYGFMQDKLDKRLSARYVADIMVLLKTVFKYAQREYNIANPFYNIVMPKCSRPEVRLLTDNEQKKLRAYLNEHNNSINLGITLALAMGLRVGEVCGLMWSDIDFKKRILTVNRSHSGVVRAKEYDRQLFSQHFWAVAVNGQEHYLWCKRNPGVATVKILCDGINRQRRYG